MMPSLALSPVLAASPAQPPERLGPHLLLAVVFTVALLAIVLIAVSTIRRRALRAAAAMPELAGPPKPMPVALATPMPGVALGTAAPSGWPDAAVHGVLGSRRSGDLIVTCAGVQLAELWLPRSVLRSVRVDQRFASKEMPGAGLLVIGWEARDRPYESGFHGLGSGYADVVAAIEGLLADADSNSDVTIVKGARA